MNVSSREDTKKYLSEAIVLRSMNHDNILPLKGISKINGQYVTITPLMVNGNLRNFVKNIPEMVCISIVTYASIIKETLARYFYTELASRVLPSCWNATLNMT